MTETDNLTEAEKIYLQSQLLQFRAELHFKTQLLELLNSLVKAEKDQIRIAALINKVPIEDDEATERK